VVPEACQFSAAPAPCFASTSIYCRSCSLCAFVSLVLFVLFACSVPPPRRQTDEQRRVRLAGRDEPQGEQDTFRAQPCHTRRVWTGVVVLSPCACPALAVPLAPALWLCTLCGALASRANEGLREENVSSARRKEENSMKP
jgi:hypothetical protein